ncbi:MAG: histidine phosphatase family protein [Pseudomonadota bacterium]
MNPAPTGPDTANNNAPRLLLLRHGQIKANKQGRWHGSTDSPLTWQGRRQARRTGQHLSANETVHAVYSSPLQRCLNTAHYASEHLQAEVQPVDGLQELSIGEWEGTRFRDLVRQHNFMQRLSDEPDYAAPGGESLNQVARRVAAALRHIEAQHAAGETALVVSHGVSIAIALSVFLQGSPSAWTEYRIRNCSLTELYLSPQPYLVGLNEDYHL